MSSDDQIIYDRRTTPSARLTILVPVFNERTTILSVLEVLQSFPLADEIVIVDDGSTDGTRDLLRDHPASKALLLFHPENAGKGQAIRTALPHVRGSHVAVQDADLEYDPREYEGMLETLEAANADVVYGSRFLLENPNIYKRFFWGNKLLTRFVNVVCGGRFTDCYTCFKLMKRSVWMDLDIVSRGFEVEAEISAKIALRKIPYAEHPIHYRPRAVEEGKKIKAMDAVKGLITIISFWRREKTRR